jgi:hypothetical protein
MDETSTAKSDFDQFIAVQCNGSEMLFGRARIGHSTNQLAGGHRAPFGAVRHNAFTGRAKSLGTKAEVLEENLSHGEINFTLGLAGTYTHDVEVFLENVLPPATEIAVLIETH